MGVAFLRTKGVTQWVKHHARLWQDRRGPSPSIHSGAHPRRVGPGRGGHATGQLPFFIEFLKVSGVFEAWVADCPLTYHSNHASDKRAVLATLLLSILAGHHRYAHITSFAMMASTRSWWAWQDSSRRMRRDGRSHG